MKWGQSRKYPLRCRHRFTYMRYFAEKSMSISRKRSMASGAQGHRSPTCGRESHGPITLTSAWWINRCAVAAVAVAGALRDLPGEAATPAGHGRLDHSPGEYSQDPAGTTPSAVPLSSESAIVDKEGGLVRYKMIDCNRQPASQRRSRLVRYVIQWQMQIDHHAPTSPCPPFLIPSFLRARRDCSEVQREVSVGSRMTFFICSTIEHTEGLFVHQPHTEGLMHLSPPSLRAQENICRVGRMWNTHYSWSDASQALGGFNHDGVPRFAFSCLVRLDFFFF